MPFQVINQGDILRIQPSGTITRQCLAFATGEVIAAEHGMNPVLNRVTDLTRVESFDISFADVWSLAELRRAERFPNRFRSAFVAAHPVEVGFALMFKSLCHNPMIQIEVFGTLEEALSWVAPG